MEKEVFAFDIIDSERFEHDTFSICMFYTREGNTLVPTHEDFETRFSTLSYDQGIEFLRKNKIKSLTTFDPDSEIVASAQYDLENEEDVRACLEDGICYRFNHEKIFEGSELERLMKESGISVKNLNPEETKSLTEKLENAYALY